MNAHTDTAQAIDLDTSLVDDLLASLGNLDEIVEVEEQHSNSFAMAVGATIDVDGNELTLAPTPAHTEPNLDEIIESAANQLDTQDYYVQQESLKSTEEQPEADKPVMDDTPVVAKRKVKADKPVRAPKVAKAQDPNAEPKAPRVTFHGNSKSTVLDARLGGRVAEYLVLEIQDAELPEEALQEKQLAIKNDLDTVVAKKVAEKAIMLFRDVAAGRSLGNEVMARAVKVLHRDGYLTSGDKGNLQTDLADKYSIGTARSQANQVFALFPFLKISVKDSKGRQVPNVNSTLLPILIESMAAAA